MRSLFYILLFISSLLLADVDSDFDGVVDSVDRCLETPFDKLVDEYGCPQDERYLGKINLEVLYTYLLEDTQKSASFYLDYNYNNLLLSLSSAYSSDYIYQDSLLIGYRVNLESSRVKLYVGMENSNLLISGSYEYAWQDYIAFLTTNYHTKESDYISYVVGVGRSYANFSFYTYYINSGSTQNYSDEYRSIEGMMSYSVSKDFYIKSGINYSLVDENLYDIYIALGVSFE